MRRKIYIQRILTIILCVIWTIIYMFVQYILKDKCFTGIKAADVQCVTQVQQVVYTVTAVRQVTDTDGKQTYRVTLSDGGNTAPTCTIELGVLPTGLDIGVDYTAQWLRVVGVYGQYTRTKDNITMQFTGEGADNNVVQMLKKEVTDALVYDLRGLVRWYYYIELVISSIVYLVTVLLLQRLAVQIIDKIFVPTDADYAQKALDSVLEEQTPQTATEALDANIAVLTEHVKQVKRRVYARQHTAQVKTLGTDSNNITTGIDVQTNLNRQRKVQRRELDKHKITPIADDIIINFQFDE